MSDSMAPGIEKTGNVQSQDALKKTSRGDKVSESKVEIRSPISGDEVKLSEATAAALETAEFDSEKVNKIKEMISKGEYPLDEKRIAESFYALEQLISDPN